MSDEARLKEWFIRLSEMVGGELSESSSLAEGLEWFGNLSEDDLAAIDGLGEENPSIRRFLDLGQSLMAELGGC